MTDAALMYMSLTEFGNGSRGALFHRIMEPAQTSLLTAKLADLPGSRTELMADGSVPYCASNWLICNAR